MAEFQELDFPPAPKLGFDGKLDPTRSESELRGQELSSARLAAASATRALLPDNTTHNLRPSDSGCRAW
jgi:hypothetical protein